MKLCSPPRQEAHFGKTIFANTVCKLKFPYLNAPKTIILRRALPLCIVQKIIVFAERAENDRFGRLCLASLAFSHALWTRFSYFSFCLLAAYLSKTDVDSIKILSIVSEASNPRSLELPRRESRSEINFRTTSVLV